MEQLKQVVATHKGVFLLALYVSIIVVAPQVVFRMQHANNGIYQGIELLPDSPWSSRVREIQDGHGLGSIYYKDGKDNPYLFQPLGSMTVAYMGELFGLDINNTILLSRIVLPFLTVLLLYGFVYLVGKDRLAALASTAAILLAYPIMSFAGLMRFLQGAAPSSFLGIARPVNDAMTFIPLFGFLVMFWLFYTRRNLSYGLASAVLLALNFYNYFYSWTYLYAFGAFLVLLFLLRRQWREAVRISGVFAGALVMVIPYGINLYRATQHPAYAEVGERFGVVASHEPLFIGLIALGALVVFLIGFPREDKERYFFGLALLLAPILTMNQQLLTGKVMQAGHYHWYFHRPIAVVFVLLTALYLLSRWKLDTYGKTLSVAILVVSLFVGAFTQTMSYLYDRSDGSAAAINRQQYGPVMRWLDQNAAKEDVVLSNEPISYLVTIYTPQNVFYHRAAPLSLSATRERLLDALFTLYRLRGVGMEDAREVFFAERGYLSWNIYGIYYREFLGSYEAIPDDKIEEMLALYQKSLATPTPEWLKEKVAQYEVNYVVWDREANPDWQLQKYPFLKEVAMFGNSIIYETDF